MPGWSMKDLVEKSSPEALPHHPDLPKVLRRRRRVMLYLGAQR